MADTAPAEDVKMTEVVKPTEEVTESETKTDTPSSQDEHNAEELVKEKGVKGAVEYLTTEAKACRLDNVASATNALSLAAQIMQKEVGEDKLSEDLGYCYLNYGDVLVENAEATVLRMSLPGFLSQLRGAAGIEQEEEEEEEEEGKTEEKEGAATATEATTEAATEKAKATEEAKPATDAAKTDAAKADDAAEKPKEGEDAEGGEEGDDDDSSSDESDAEEATSDPEEDLQRAWEVLELAYKCLEEKVTSKDEAAVKGAILAKTRLGDILSLKQQFKEAIAEYETSITLQKDNKISQYEALDAMLGLIECYEHLKDNVKAAPLAETAVELLTALVAQGDSVPKLTTDELSNREIKLGDLKERLRDYKAFSTSGKVGELKDSDEDPANAEPSAELTAKVIKQARKIGAIAGKPEDHFAASTINSESTTVEPRREAADEGPTKKRKVDDGAAPVAEA